MTLPSLRKRPTTAVRAATTRARTSAEPALLSLLLLAGVAGAGSPYAAVPPPPPPLARSVPAAAAPVRMVQPPAIAVPAAPSVTVPRLVTPTRYQLPDDRRGAAEAPEYQIQLVPPGLERLSRLDSEAMLRERIRQETRDRDPKEQVVFPDGPILSRDVYRGRGTLWPAREMVVEPNFVCYKRLLFEQPNFERAGWDLGIVGPLVSSARFLGDVVALPYNLGVRPCDHAETSAGRCLPGDPTPLLLYPPEVSLTGTVLEAAAITALIVAFP